MNLLMKKNNTAVKASQEQVKHSRWGLRSVKAKGQRSTSRPRAGLDLQKKWELKSKLQGRRSPHSFSPQEEQFEEKSYFRGRKKKVNSIMKETGTILNDSINPSPRIKDREKVVFICLILTAH